MPILDRLKEFTLTIYRLRVLAITTAVIVLPFVVYQLFYVRSQTSYFTDQSFRKLSLISSQLATRVDSAGLVLTNKSKKFLTDPANKSFNLKDPKVYDGLVAPLQDDDPKVILLNIQENISDQGSPETVSLTSVQDELDSAWLYLDSVFKLPSEKVVRVRGKVDFKNLVQPFMHSPSTIGFERGQFENLLISEADTGRVIFQQEPTQIRLASLDNLSAIGDTGKSIDLKDVGKTSSVVDITLAGSNYKLFSQPIKFSFSTNGDNVPSTAWIVSGLIRADHFRSETWSISYTVLLIFGFFAMMLVLSWPFLKLILTGQKDRLRTADIYFLVLSTLIGLGVLTSFVFYLYLYYYHVNTQMNTQLQALACNIKTNFSNELDQALNQLDTLSNNHALLKKLEHQDGQREVDEPKEDNPYQKANLEKTDLLAKLWKLPQTTYPYFDTVVWLDDKGMQQAKWTVKGNLTQNISVSDRAYFKNIRLGHYYEVGGKKFWLEPIISKSTGRKEVEISKATTDPKYITAFNTQLISLMYPVLPDSFGFAIIENDGKVLFHSDQAHDFGENFFQECDGNAELRSAVMGRNDTKLDVRYLGGDYSMRVTTVPHFPDWSLIVFRNKEPLCSAFVDLISSVSRLFLFYCIPFLFGFAALYLFNSRNERRAWLWPAKKKTEIYIQSLILLLVLSVVSVCLAFRLHGDYLVGISALIGFLSAFSFFVNLRFGKAWFRPQFLKKLFLNPGFAYPHLAYVLNVTFLLLVIAVLPAAAFFMYAYETEMKLFFRHEQFTTATALAKRDDRIRNQYLNIKTVPGTPDKSISSTEPASGDRSGKANSSEQKKPSNQTDASMQPEPSEFVKRRLNDVRWDIYESFFFNTSLKPVEDETACTKGSTTDFLTNLTTCWWLPFSSQASIERRGLANPVIDGVGQWETDETEYLVLHLNSTAFSEIDRHWRHLKTEFQPSKTPKLVWLGIFALLFVPFLWIVNFVVRKIFLLDIYKPTTAPLGSLLSTEIKRNIFVVVDAPFIEKTTSSQSNLYLKDLRTIATTSNWAKEFTDSLPASEQVIGIDNFDFNMSDPRKNVKKLGLVENLLQKKRKLVIFSSVEPSQYQFNIDNRPGTVNGGQDGRWAEIMSLFVTEYAEDNGNPKQFKRQVVKERKRILSGDLKGRSPKEIEELICTLCAECAPKGPLQNIGLQILAEESFITLTREHLLNRIINQARTYYTHLWNSRSINEKLTLSHLAQDRLLNHRDPDIEPLLRRELIVRNEDVHLMNDSFREFIRATDQISIMAEHDEKAKESSLWENLKGPLLLIMVALAVFLFVTQQDLYTSSLALLTAVTTIIPAFFKVLSLFQREPRSRPPSQSYYNNPT